MIQFIEVRLEDNRLQFIPTSTAKLASEITCLSWLSPQLLIVVDKSDHLLLWDPYGQTKLEKVNTKDMELVYHTRFANAALQESNPGSIMTIYCYEGTFKVHKGTLFLLGIKKLYVSTLLSWEERISSVLLQGDFLPALSLCRQFYYATDPTIMGLPKEISLKNQILTQKILDLLMAYLDEIFHKYAHLRGKKQGENYSEVSLCIGACMEYCSIVSRVDVLFGEIFEKFRKVEWEFLFLEMLEAFILAGKMRLVNPEVLKLFVEHSKDNAQNLQIVEECILNLDIANLDFHQVSNWVLDFAINS
jgi:hypothetical protein